MEQINIGGQENYGITARDGCLLCDYDPPHPYESHNDVCTCCDMTDWVKKDD